MKNVLAVCFLLLAIIGCKKDEVNPQPLQTPETETHPIHGKWNLIRAIQGWAPMYEYAEGEILFEFRTDNILIIQIAEGVEASPYMPLNQSGEYTFAIQDTSLVAIDNMLYSLSTQAEVMILDMNMAADGFGFFLTPSD